VLRETTSRGLCGLVCTSHTSERGGEGDWKKKTQKLAVHACACADNGGEKRNVLTVSVLLPVAVNFALRSKTQRRTVVIQKQILRV
jgi:hypothetical protein